LSKSAERDVRGSEGVGHKPYAEREVKLLLIERAGCSKQGMKVVNGLRRMTCGFDDVPADCRLEFSPNR
jgi:hypothetical protein